MNLSDKYFDQFVVSFRHKNLTRYDDSLVYKCPDGWAEAMSHDANVLIKQLNIPLESTPTTSFRKDSFCVKQKEDKTKRR